MKPVSSGKQRIPNRSESVWWVDLNGNPRHSDKDELKKDQAQDRNAYNSKLAKRLHA